MRIRLAVGLAVLCAAAPLAAQAKPQRGAPLLSDLKLVGIYYDARYPARSVAVLRDVTNSKVYRVKPADILGRLKVTTIRPREIVFTVQEFGFERQETLTLAKQEVSP